MISMNVPEDREYTRSHEWIRLDGESAVVGLTANDPENFAEITRIELPQVGNAVKGRRYRGDSCFCQCETDRARTPQWQYYRDQP